MGEQPPYSGPVTPDGRVGFSAYYALLLLSLVLYILCFVMYRIHTEPPTTRCILMKVLERKMLDVHQFKMPL